MAATLEQNLREFNNPNVSNIDNNFIEGSFDQIFKA
jgi:hypothetical protein